MKAVANIFYQGEQATNWPGWVRWIQAIGLVTLIILVPLAKGGMLEWVRAVFIALVALLFMAEWLPRTVQGQWPGSWEWAWLMVWLVVSAYLLIQVVPLPTWLLKIVGAYPDYFRQGTADQLVRISPQPLETTAYWATFSAYWAVAWMVATFRYRLLVLLVLTITVLAVFESLYGMFAFVQGQETILGIWPKQHYRNDVTGSFVNKNHFAGLLALCWPLGLALILNGVWSPGKVVHKAPQYAVAMLYSALVGLALLNSHSRLGVVSALTGLAVWMTLELHRARHSGSRLPRWLPWAMVGVAVLAGIWFGLAPLAEHFLRLPSETGRFEAWSAVLTLPWQAWFMGIGAGSFEDVFRMVQPGSLSYRWQYAHNDWLQFLLEFGLFGSLIVLVALVYWLHRVKPRSLTLFQSAALAGVLAMAVHSLGDFNLRIPGTALVFWVAVGILLNRESIRVSKGEGTKGPRE